jgi:hypothetical protein
MPDVIDPTVNPADFTDPMQQRKTAESVLTQLGLHPNQSGARNLLDLHFQGPTAHPEVSSTIAPLINTPTNVSGVSNPPNGGEVNSIETPPQETPKVKAFREKISTPNPNVNTNQVVPGEQPTAPARPMSEHLGLPANGSLPQGNINLGGIPATVHGTVPTTAATPPVGSPDVSQSAQPLITSSPAAVPTPTSADRLIPGMDQKRSEDEARLHDLIHAGSGISQIHNPWLRGLATAGDIAEGTLFPRAAQLTPGTTAHHEALVKGAEGLVNQDLTAMEKESQVAKDRQLDEFQTWKQQNPNKPIQNYWKAKMEGEFGKRTPEQQYMTDLISRGVPVDQAFEAMMKDISLGKPPTAASQEAAFQGILGKMIQGGGFDSKSIMDIKTLTDAIQSSAALTPEEKSTALAHLTAKSSPASQAGVANIRGEDLQKRGLYQAVDTTTGQMTYITAYDNNQEPGRYIPLQGAEKQRPKEAVFSDLHYNLDTTRNALNNLDQGLSMTQRAQLALTFMQPTTLEGLHGAWDQFIKSDVLSTLSPKQVDYVTSLYMLAENAMALRSVQGAGQSSDMLRSAIRDMIPGPGTPNVQYGNRQLDLLEKQLERFETGVIKTGLPTPAFTPPKPTAEQPTGNTPKPPVAPPKPLVAPGQPNLQGSMPPQDIIDKARVGQYIHSPDGKKSWIKMPDGTLKEQ